jgi:hypothetical protein
VIPVKEAHRNVVAGVEQAKLWLREHPDRDYLDAAYEIACNGGLKRAGVHGLSTELWPRFVTSLKAAVTHGYGETAHD